jgi:hypothetical protein
LEVEGFAVGIRLVGVAVARLGVEVEGSEVEGFPVGIRLVGVAVARLGEVEGFPVGIRKVDGVRLGVEVLGAIVLGAVKC